VPHLSHEYQHPLRIGPDRAGSTNQPVAAARAAQPADRFNVVRYLALLVLAVVFLTGLVWWVVFLGNAALHLIRRR
jgi:cytoskeletal protein RodZ